MADDITDQTLGAPELAARDIPFTGARDDDTPLEDRSSSVLDDLLKTKTAEKAPVDEPETVDVEKEAAAKKASEEAEKAKADEAAKKATKADPAAEAKKVADDKAAADKSAAEKKASEPKDALSGITLGPHAKPATVESFNKVKDIARGEINKLKAELEETKKKVPTGPSKIDPAVEKELKDLREFKATFAYEKSEEFLGKYAKPLEETEKGIFDRLAKLGLTAEQVADVKKLGLDTLDWGNLFEKIKNPVAQRSIEALLLKREQLVEGKAKELEDASKRPAEYAAKQKQAEEASKVESKTRFEKTYKEYLDKVPWSKKVEIPTTATAEERLALESQNKFADEQNKRLENVIKSFDTPEGKGDLVATALFAYALKSRVESLEAENKAVTEELAKIKKSTSTTRAARSAPPPGSVKKEEKSDIFLRADDALDRLRKEKESAE